MRVFSSLKDAIDSGDSKSYIVGGEGVLKVSRYGGANWPVEFHTVTKTDKPTALDEVGEGVVMVKLVYPPKELVEKAIAVFRAAYKKWSTEMCVILKWIPGTEETPGQYALDRPRCAVVSGAHVKHVYTEPRMGVIHSHPGFSGIPSGIDDHNETPIPGVYLVIGDIQSSTPSLTFSVCGDGFRVTREYPHKEFSPPNLSDEETAWWLENVMTQGEIDAKTEGWLLKDQNGQTLFWFSDEETAKAVGPDFKVEKVEPKKSYAWTSPWKLGGIDDFYDEFGQFYAAFRREEPFCETPASDVPAEPDKPKTDEDTQIIPIAAVRREMGRNKNKRRNGKFSLYLPKQMSPSAWRSLGKLIRTQLEGESLEVKMALMDGLFHGAEAAVMPSSRTKEIKI